MAFRRTRIVGEPEDPTRQRVKKPTLQGPAVEPVHADPHALQSGQINPAGVQRLQRAIGNRAVSEMIVQRGMPPEEEEKVGTPSALPPMRGPIPTPYPTMGAAGGSKATSQEVRIESKKALNAKVPLERRSGDEGGTLKGMMSSTNMDKMKFKSGSSKVVFQGAGVVTGSAPMATDQEQTPLPTATPANPSQTPVREDED